VHRNTFGDRDDQLDTSLGRFQTRGTRRGAGTMTMVAVAPVSADRFLHRREHRNAVHIGAGLLRAHATDNLRAVLALRQSVEATWRP